MIESQSSSPWGSNPGVKDYLGLAGGAAAATALSFGGMGALANSADRQSAKGHALRDQLQPGKGPKDWLAKADVLDQQVASMGRRNVLDAGAAPKLREAAARGAADGAQLLRGAAKGASFGTFARAAAMVPLAPVAVVGGVVTLFAGSSAAYLA